MQEASPSSYYAIFDGHAGYHAAGYCATHLHQFLAESPHFISNPEKALYDAFCETDQLFLNKCKTEVEKQRFTSFAVVFICDLL